MKNTTANLCGSIAEPMWSESLHFLIIFFPIISCCPAFGNITAKLIPEDNQQ